MSDENNQEEKGLGQKEKIFIIIIVALAVVIMIIGMIINVFMPAGKVVISIDNKEYEEISLKENKKVVIDNEYGKNVVIIKDGQVYIESADCPDKTCVKQGKIMKTGQSIVCLPHRLTITITD